MLYKKSLLLFFYTFSIGVYATENIPLYPMMDGKCNEYENLENSITTNLGSGVTLYSFQDKDYVWFCYTKPEKSWGMLDLYIKSPNVMDARNLHVSAQLGEWPADKPNSIPTTPNSNIWWEINGWWANILAPHGVKTYENGQSYPNFKLAPGREIVLSKNHFGRGDWYLQFAIKAIHYNNKNVTIHYPENLDGKRQTIVFNAN